MSTSGYLPVNGAQLYYESYGQGPAIVLLHAGVADSRMWQQQVPEFARYFQVVCFDMRGYGKSDLPAGSFTNHEDVKGVMDQLGLTSAHIIGVSFGGLVALDFALAYPNYVNRLVLGATSASGHKPSDQIKAFWELEEAAFERGELEAATRLNVEFWVDGPQRTPDQVDSAVRDLVYDMQLIIFQKEEPDDVEVLGLEPPAMERLAELTTPSLLLVGELDFAEKLRLVDQLAATIPGSQKMVLPGVAHMLNMERPSQFNQAVLNFLTA